MIVNYVIKVQVQIQLVQRQMELVLNAMAEHIKQCEAKVLASIAVPEDMVQ